MKTHFDIEKLVESGAITNELDFERALVADRKLRLLSKENVQFSVLREKLRDLIEKYEKAEWSHLDKISDKKIAENEQSERIAEAERKFIERRKQEIKMKLKQYDLSQEDLAMLLGHKSKTHMSELINGIKPFTLKDLIIISQLLKVAITKLVPVYLSKEDQTRVQAALKRLDKPKVKLSSGVLALA
jgi:antitoxin component HigA of HigAB toxin-antitoxin module